MFHALPHACEMNSNNSFILKSEYLPTGDQPQAIEKIVSELKRGEKHIVLLGVTGSGKTFTVANVIEKLQIPALVISHNKTLAAQLTQEFKEFFPQNAVEYFVSYYDYYQPEAYIPRTDTYIEKEADINDEIERLRLAATTSLSTRSDVIVCASVSCIYNIGDPKGWQNRYLRLVKNQYWSPENLVKWLVGLFYNRADFDFKRNTFRQRGNIMQIYPSHAAFVVSVELDYQELASGKEAKIIRITRNDPVSLQVQEELDYAVFYPSKHHVVQEEGFKEAVEQIKIDLDKRVNELNALGKKLEAYRLSQRTNYDLEMLQELGYCSGIENYSRYFDGRKPGQAPYTLIDYFNKFNNWLLVIDESHITIPQIRGMYHGDKSRKEVLIEHGFRLPSAIDNRPLKFDEFQRRIKQNLYTSATPNIWELSMSGKDNVVEQLIRPTGLVDPQITIQPTTDQIPHLIEEIKLRISKEERVLVTTLTKRMAEALSEKLKELGIKAAYLHADVETLERSDILDNLRSGEYDVLVGINLLREGLDLPEVSLVAILDADKEGFLRSQTSLVQVMGRAARHINGQVIMYADTITGSMEAAINEVNRRREIQLVYNKKHSITPQSIIKARRSRLIDKKVKASNQQLEARSLKKLPPAELESLAKDYELRMQSASQAWDFEQAAFYRDELKKIKKVIGNRL